MMPKTLKLYISDMMDADLPLWLWGPPGVGKSQIVKQVAAEKGVEFLDVRLTTMDPVDLRGLPHVVKGKSMWARPSFLPEKGRGVMLLDEIAQSRPEMQAAAMELVLDRRVGDHVVGPDWRIIAASNRAEDRAGAGRVITPLLNRFTHVDVEPSLSDWVEWAEGADVDFRIQSFLKFRPDRLLAFDPSSTERAYPTPRSWEMCSRALKAARGSLHREAVKSAVGEAAGTELMAFLSLYASLPDIDRVWADPDNAPVPTELSACWAMGGVLCEGIRGVDKPGPKTVAFAKYACRMNEEVAIAVFNDGFRVCPGALMNTPETMRFLGAKIHYIAANYAEKVSGGR